VSVYLLAEHSGRCELGGLPRMRHKPRLIDLLNLVN